MPKPTSPKRKSSGPDKGRPKRPRPERVAAGPRRARPERDSAAPRRAPRAPSFAKQEEPEQRRSLSHRGGEIERKGDDALSELLAVAFAASETAPGDDLTHGFHTYPARMHPAIAAHLIPELTEKGDVVLDCFCGSGTVLVEALVRGRQAAGVDLDPLALRIAAVHTELRDSRSRARFVRTLNAVAGLSEARVRAREVIDIPISRTEMAFYDPHVRFEMAGLLAEIERVPEADDRRAMAVVFSSLVVKFSRQRADTSEELVEKRIRKGLVTEFFARKGAELAARWEALYDETPKGAPPARIFQGDARALKQMLGPRFGADLVLTSPPYGGTYDYVNHHARRRAWLKLDASALLSSEIGARRNFTESGAKERWDRELLSVLRSLQMVLKPRGRIVLFLGDAEIGNVRLPADSQVARLAPFARLELLASASQPRPDFRGGSSRREHLLLLGHGHAPAANSGRARPR